MEDIKPDQTLDARGLSCPMPVSENKKGHGESYLRTGPGNLQHRPGNPQ